MCSQYTISFAPEDLTHEFTNGFPPNSKIFSARILPYREAPVIVQHKDELKMTPMSFSLVPSWSAEPKVKFATHNARLETVTQKPTWKEPFRKQHCLEQIL